MKVTIKYYTLRPMDQISEHAGISYGRTDASMKRVKHCWDNGHMSVFEVAYVRFVVEGISRTCSHQLVRHRLFSMCQQSQRYTTIKGEDWYVVPPAFEGGYLRTAYELQMGANKGAYEMALKQGIKPEDARFLLPEATKTDISVSTNVRELFHFFDLRCDKSAQWEIRELANVMLYACKGLNGQWEQLIELWESKVVTREEIVSDALDWFGVDEGDSQLIKEATEYINSMYDRIKKGGR